MSLAYGVAKSKLTSVAPQLKATSRPGETQWHQHFGLNVQGQDWDVAVNVGTDKASDLLKYKLLDSYVHPMLAPLRTLPAGSVLLTGKPGLPALDFLRSDILAGTRAWQESTVVSVTSAEEPAAGLRRRLLDAMAAGHDVCVFGRFYSEGNGLHDVHFNQGSTGSAFRHTRGNDSNDHNDIWQDGAVLIDVGRPAWIAYFAAFDQQRVPTDDLGNPTPNAGPIDSSP